MFTLRPGEDGPLGVAGASACRFPCPSSLCLEQTKTLGEEVLLQGLGQDTYCTSCNRSEMLAVHPRERGGLEAGLEEPLTGSGHVDQG